MNSRDKIIAAAVSMRQRDPNTALSVRAVAAEAGVSTGTLRHFFPTQRQLRDTVFSTIYANVFSDGDLFDRSIPARERLLARLSQMVAAAGTLEQTTYLWTDVFNRFVYPDATEAARNEFIELGRHTQDRVVSWLRVLIDEGAMPEGNNEMRARFLLTVVSGVLIERVLPTAGPWEEQEVGMLALAVEAVFAAPVGTGARQS